MVEFTDEELVAAITAGDQQAAAWLDGHFRERIEAMARKRGYQAADCADIVQEVLSDAIRQICRGNFRGDASLSTWIYTITKGKMADLSRKRAAGRKTVPLDLVSERHQALVATGNPDAVLAVQRALAFLSPEEQFVLLLHEQQRYTFEEIGRMMHLRKSAVAERLDKAREHFRVAFRDGGKKPGPRRLKE